MQDNSTAEVSSEINAYNTLIVLIDRNERNGAPIIAIRIQSTLNHLRQETTAQLCGSKTFLGGKLPSGDVTPGVFH